MLISLRYRIHPPLVLSKNEPGTASVAQLVEQSTNDPKFVGLNPHTASNGEKGKKNM